MSVRELSYGDAISEATVQAMELDSEVFVMGLGVDDYKGIFGTTLAAHQKFGNARVIGTPACENAMTGIAIGAALNGKRPLLVHARNDFMFLALDQLINNASKWKYAYAGKSAVPFVTRGIIGRGWGQGPTHSQSIQSVLAHFPGIYVAMPSSPYIAKGILMEGLRSSVPVILLEHRSLYSMKEPVPVKPYMYPFGQGLIVHPGKDMTVVATSAMVKEAVKAAHILKKEGIGLEVIDPVSIQPLDEKIILTSVKKTGYLICADTSWASCGFASEVSALVAEKGFRHLKGPIKRVTLPACPAPVSRELEEAFYPDYRDIVSSVEELIGRDLKIDLEKYREVDAFKGPY